MIVVEVQNWCWHLLRFIFPLVLGVTVEIEVSGKGGSGIAFSPREELKTELIDD